MSPFHNWKDCFPIISLQSFDLELFKSVILYVLDRSNDHLRVAELFFMSLLVGTEE